MGGRKHDEVGERITQAATLFGQDTVMTALRTMKELGVRQLAVVDDQNGGLLGEITEEQLRDQWEIAPLASMSEILSAPPEETLQNGQPEAQTEVVVLAPLVDYFGQYSGSGLN